MQTQSRSSNNLRRVSGLGILVVVALIIILIKSRDDEPVNGYEPLHLTGAVGGKLAFFDDPEVIELLKTKYNLTVTPTRVGSFKQVDLCKPPYDFCWPSSQIASQLMVDQLGSTALGTQIIFNSPIVVYSWTPIVDALITQGIVEKEGDVYYIADFQKLIEMINNGTTWASVGLPVPTGPMQILTTDPIESNTGNSFTGLLANTLNGGVPVDATTVDSVIPPITSFVDRMGLLPTTTTQLFEQFLNLGQGAAPMIVAYESNLIEYSISHPTAQHQNYIKNDVRMLYPKPTVWSEQPMTALTEGGQRLIQALRDPEMQRIGWENHGFRPGNPSYIADTGSLSQLGVARTIDHVIPMPSVDAMVRIMDALKPEEST